MGHFSMETSTTTGSNLSGNQQLGQQKFFDGIFAVNWPPRPDSSNVLV
jgi:hypothetical protein